MMDREEFLYRDNAYWRVHTLERRACQGCTFAGDCPFIVQDNEDKPCTENDVDDIFLRQTNEAWAEYIAARTKTRLIGATK